MRTIYKYRVDIGGSTYVSLPSGYFIKHVDMQQDDLCFWAEVDRNEKTESVEFRVVGTGHQIPDGAQYVGTAQSPPFVWHLYKMG